MIRWLVLHYEAIHIFPPPLRSKSASSYLSTAHWRRLCQPVLRPSGCLTTPPDAPSTLLHFILALSWLQAPLFLILRQSQLNIDILDRCWASNRIWSSHDEKGFCQRWRFPLLPLFAMLIFFRLGASTAVTYFLIVISRQTYKGSSLSS